jgi:hypothetical protein
MSAELGQGNSLRTSNSSPFLHLISHQTSFQLRLETQITVCELSSELETGEARPSVA